MEAAPVLLEVWAPQSYLFEAPAHTLLCSWKCVGFPVCDHGILSAWSISKTSMSGVSCFRAWQLVRSSEGKLPQQQLHGLEAALCGDVQFLRAVGTGGLGGSAFSSQGSTSATLSATGHWEHASRAYNLGVLALVDIARDHSKTCNKSADTAAKESLQAPRKLRAQSTTGAEWGPGQQPGWQ